MRRQDVATTRESDRPRIPMRRAPGACDDDLVSRVRPAQRTPRRYEFECCDDVVMPRRKIKSKS
jgi:hypothetical protein